MLSINKIVQKFLMLEYNKEEIKSQVEIIYRDPNIIAMIPKSQITSYLYGKNADWCQKTKAGFDGWTRESLLIRFLFKNKRKVRFTYFFDGTYYWANENGYHVLSGAGNPFEASVKGKRIRSMEQDILNIIANDIPEDCKNQVLKFIDAHKSAYEYCILDKEYHSYRQDHLDELVAEIKKEFDTEITSMRVNYNNRISLDSNIKDNVILITWTLPDLTKKMFRAHDKDKAVNIIKDIVENIITNQARNIEAA